MIILSLLILGIYLYFTFSILNSQRELALQWRNYINPLNQVLLFLGGFLSGYFLINISIKNSILLIMLFIGFGTFLMYPTNTENIDLVTGVNRIVFTVCCFLICIFFYKLNYKLPNIIHLPLILLGEASYSVYLLHPIVFNIVDILEYKFGRHFYPLSRWGKVTVTIVLTLLFSYLVFRYFEKFFMQLGKKVKSKKD